MKISQNDKRISFEFADKKAAVHFAQRIANACGGTVLVVDEAGEDVAKAKLKHSHSATMTIASIQRLADEMGAKTKH